MEDTFSGSQLRTLDPELGAYLVYCLCHQYRVTNKKPLVKVWNAIGHGDQQRDPENLRLPTRNLVIQWMLDTLARRRGVSTAEGEAINQTVPDQCSGVVRDGLQGIHL